MARNVAVFIRGVLIDLAISVARRLLEIAQRLGNLAGETLVTV